MAYFNQEMKKVLVQRLKEEFPGWKFGVKVVHHSEVVVQIKSAPIDLLTNYMANIPQSRRERTNTESSINLNHHYLRAQFSDVPLKEMQRLLEVVNLRDTKFANYDNSVVQADYFDIGYYIQLVLGFNEKPFTYTGK